MAKNESLYENAGPRKELASCIKYHLSTERMDAAMSLPDKKRYDAIGHIVSDAVKNSPIVSFSGIPHVYSKSRGIYVPFDFHEFKTAIDDALRRSGVPDGNYSRLGKMVSDSWSEVMCRKFMTDQSVVVMKNGVFDTYDMKLHEYNESYMTNMKVDYEYNPNDIPVMWKKFLGKVLPDIELQNTLQEFVAATFVDRRFAKIEHMLTLMGSGSNGKSVVFEVIMAALGECNVSTFSIRDLTSSARSQQNIASCTGKRLNYCSEMRTSSINPENADAFKSLVSGEPMMARSLYKEPFKVSSLPLIMTNANRMPSIDDPSYSLQRRIIIIPFNVTIPEEEQDIELPSKLKTELSGIFNWIMEGFIRLKANKYRISIPSVVKELVSEYFKDNNPLSRWLDENRMYSRSNQYSSSLASWQKTTILLGSFNTWCVENGEQKISSRKFAEGLENLGFVRTRRSEGYGFSFYKVPSMDDIVEANMNLAISMQSKILLDKLENEALNNARPKVTGLLNLEKYLGVPEGSIMKYMASGQLEGSYTRMRDGQVVFDIMNVQKRLAEADFYMKLKDDHEKSVIKERQDMRVMRRTFNTSMRLLGKPFRKYNSVNDSIPNNERDCIIVPDEWQYNENAAKKMIAAHKRELNNK